MPEEQDPISEAIDGTVNDVTQGCFGSFLVLLLITGLGLFFCSFAGKSPSGLKVDGKLSFPSTESMHLQSRRGLARIAPELQTAKAMIIIPMVMSFQRGVMLG